MRAEIREARALPFEIEDLVRAGLEEGFAFVGRLVEDWRAELNRFDLPGEVFLLAYADSKLVGYGGLNVDPYQADPRVGRIRHVYVLPEARSKGIGGLLVRELIVRAQQRFLVLRLTTQQAASFYEHLGFAPVAEHKCTHKIVVAPIVNGRADGLQKSR